MKYFHSVKTNSVFQKSLELSFVTPQVIAYRLARMASAKMPASLKDQKEFHKMVVEKTDAFNESWNAMAIEMVKANYTLSTSIFYSFFSPKLKKSPISVATQFRKTTLSMLNKGLTPVHRRAVANAKRLSKAKIKNK